MDDQAQWQQLLDGLRRGDPNAGREFWQRYSPVLQGLANKNLAGWLQRRVDPDDVVQSACRTFLRHLQAGAYQLEDSQGLMALLCAITLNKVRTAARFHRAGRRDLRREDAAPAPESGPLDLPGPDPSPDEAAAFAEEFEGFLAGLHVEERRIVDLKLQGHSQQEIAAALHRSDRWVRRLCERMRTRLGGEEDGA